MDVMGTVIKRGLDEELVGVEFSNKGMRNHFFSGKDYWRITRGKEAGRCRGPSAGVLMIGLLSPGRALPCGVFQSSPFLRFRRCQLFHPPFSYPRPQFLALSGR